MGRGGSAYERELREILEGDPAAVARYSRSIDPVDRSTLDRIFAQPFLVVRAAGSLGFDLVALRNEFSFPIEVKASAGETILFSAASGRASHQLDSHRRAVERVGLIVLYAFRRLGLRGRDPWRLYAVAGSKRPGRLALLQRRLPAVDATRGGNGVLRWDDGLPLVRFLEYVFLLTEPSQGETR